MVESLYKRRVAAGLCGVCGKVPHLPDSPLCAVDLERSRLRAAAKRKKQKAAGLCCHSTCPDPPAPGKQRCQKHLDEQNERQKQTVAGWAAAGKCHGCGGKYGLPMPDCVLCERCSHDRSVISSEHYRRRKEAGLCNYCKKTPEPGESLCANHKQYAADYRSLIKLEVFTHYGNGEAACSGCGNSNLDELDLHHMANDGREDRLKRSSGGGGHGFYLSVRSDSYPPGLIVLCAGCHRKTHAGVPLPNQENHHET